MVGLLGEGFAPFAYGGSTYLEALDAHGGWIASAADLVRFATAVDGQRGPALLMPESVQALVTTPRPPTEAPSTGYPGVTAEVTAGLGWDMIPEAGGVAWSRVGALIGSTAAWVNRRPDGVAIAFAVNSLPRITTRSSTRPSPPWARRSTRSTPGQKVISSGRRRRPRLRRETG